MISKYIKPHRIIMSSSSLNENVYLIYAWVSLEFFTHSILAQYYFRFFHINFSLSLSFYFCYQIIRSIFCLMCDSHCNWIVLIEDTHLLLSFRFLWSCLYNFFLSSIDHHLKWKEETVVTRMIETNCTKIQASNEREKLNLSSEKEEEEKERSEMCVFACVNLHSSISLATVRKIVQDINELIWFYLLSSAIDFLSKLTLPSNVIFIHLLLATKRTLQKMYAIFLFLFERIFVKLT